jgi:hypothetical protein
MASSNAQRLSLIRYIFYSTRNTIDLRPITIDLVPLIKHVINFQIVIT